MFGSWGTYSHLTHFVSNCFPTICGGHLEFLRITQTHLSWKWYKSAISTKFWAHRVYTVIWHSFNKAFSCNFCRLVQFLHKWKKHIKQSKIVISAKSLMLTGMLCFCSAKKFLFLFRNNSLVYFCHTFYI